MLRKIRSLWQKPAVAETAEKMKNEPERQETVPNHLAELINRAYLPPETLETYEKEEVPVIPESTLKLIAFYLPQFHPFEENDRFWGKGFTEWHNVTRALPLFPGHYQPRLPGELGFYDLRVKEVMQRQVELAKQYGIHGFCFHHYFLDMKPVMRLPLDQFLNNPDLDFPFCIHWANEPWTSRWDGNRKRGGILLDQVHDDRENMAFLEDAMPAFRDERYILVEDKPLLIVYRPGLFPDFRKTAEQWREHMIKSGFKGLFLVMVQTLFDPVHDPAEYGCDAALEFPPHGFKKISIKSDVGLFDPGFKGDIFSLKEYIADSLSREKPHYLLLRGLFPQWDNTSRRIQANVYHESTPMVYQDWLQGLMQYTVKNLPEDRQFIFINAWNEWAEGAYLEPDRKFGYAYLNATARALNLK